MIRNRLFRFLLVTFSISYLCWGVLAVLTQTGVLEFTHPLAVILHLLGGFGPTFAAFFEWRKSSSIRETVRSIFACRKNTTGYLILFGILEILTVGLSSMKFNPQISFFQVPLILIQAIFLFGGEEELGWRGVMQPILEEKIPLPLAALATGMVWSVWHLPLWFVVGASQQNMPFIPFAALAILQSFWYAVLYRKTKSLFFCSVLHGLTNTLLSLFVIQINMVLVMGFLIMTATAAWIWWAEKCRKS